jgi:glycosyltransferase involved in cell wall biosynthesis
MRLAILGTRGVPARYGGFETFAENLSIRLAERGYSVTVYCEASRDGLPTSYKGVRLAYAPAFPLGPLATIAFDAICLWRARRSYDVVYMLGVSAPFLFFLPRMHRTRLWVNVDGVEWKRSKWGWLGRAYLKAMEALAVRSASRVIADCQAIAALLARNHARMAPCTVIAYGARVVETPPDPELLSRWGLEAGAYYLIVCRLEPENQVLEAALAFLKSGSRRSLAIVGTMQPGRRYVAALRELAGDKVKLLGAVYDQRLLDALRFHCWAYFHGHTVGGTNPSLLEALGCGNVVIAHDNAFNREVCGKLALYFGSAGEIPGVVAGAERLDPAQRSVIAERGRARIRSAYSWEAIADRYEAVLRKEGTR